MWNLSKPSEAPKTVGSHDQPVKDVASFVADGKIYLVSAGWDAYIKYWAVNDDGSLTLVNQVYLAKPIHKMSL